MQNFTKILVLSAALACLCAGTPASGQLVLTGSSHADGEANVPMVDSIYFYFAQQLPFNSLFTSKFYWEPRGQYQRTEVFLDEDRMSPRFRLIHQQNTDFSVYVFGVSAANGAKMERPFALNYTTASSSGSRQLSGSVAFGTRTPSSQPPIAGLIRQHYQHNIAASAVGSVETTTDQQRVGMFTATFADAPIQVQRQKLQSQSGEQRNQIATALDATRASDFRAETNEDRSPQPVELSTSVQKSALANDLDHTVILLLDEYSVDELQWTVKAAAAITAAGTFSFAHVRDGTYYPIAFNYASNTGDAIGHYGYYDPDGDFMPNPISVSGGNVSGVELTLYSYSPSQAFGYREIAEAEAESVASDAKLLQMTASTALNGTSSLWTFQFYSSSLNKDILVDVDPLTISTSIFPPAYTSSTTVLPSSGLTDSAPAVGIADSNGGFDYRQNNPGPLSITVTGGNLLSDFPSAPTMLLWKVQYSVAGNPGDPFVIYLDMHTGEPFELLPVELVRFEGVVDGESIRIEWSTLSETNNSGFHVQRRRRESDAWSSVAFAPGQLASSDQINYAVDVPAGSPGHYSFRLMRVNVDGSTSYSSVIEVDVSFGSSFHIDGPYPNPADVTASLQFSVPSAGQLNIAIYDALGRRAQTAFEGESRADGVQSVKLELAGLAEGLYFVVAESGNFRVTKKLVIQR